MLLIQQIIVVALIAGYATVGLQRQAKLTNVQASAIVTLLAGLILPSFFTAGLTLAAVATAVSYAGMSAVTRISSQKNMAIISVVCGGVFFLTQQQLVGYGGRLGTIAALSVLVFMGLNYLIVLSSNIKPKASLSRREKEEFDHGNM